MIKYYKLKYYLNAAHSFGGNLEQKHAHTFAITLFLETKDEEFVAFYQIEKRLRQYFEDYGGKYLNELPEFAYLEPTTENIGDYFYEELRRRLKKYQMHLMQLSISETPVRKYSISDQLLISSAGIDGKEEVEERWDELLRNREEHLLERY